MWGMCPPDAHIHTGHGNLDVNCKMGDTVQGTTVEEKDLGETIKAGIKVSEQCGTAASNGNKMLWLVMRNIHTRKKIELYRCIKQ